MVRFIFSILLLLSPLNLLAQEAILDVNPKIGSLDDIFQMKILVSGSSDTHPTIKGGDKFDIKFIGPQHSLNIINGNVSQQTIYVYSLVPKEVGKLKSPSAVVKINGSFQTLPAKQIQVKKRSAKASNELVKLSRWTNSSNIYLGEQLVSTLTLYQRVNISDSQLNEGDYDGFWVEHIGTKKRFAAKLAGHQAEATGFTRVLFPLRTGTLSIQPSVLSGKMTISRRRRSPFGFGTGIDPFDEIFGRVEVKQISVRSEEAQVKVRKLPLAPKGIPNLDKINPLVGKTKVEAYYDAGAVDFGKGKTVVFKVKSYGNLNPLQKLPIENTPEYKIYEDNSYITNEVKGDKVEFTKHFPITIIPLRGGVVKIPAIKLSYFDPDQETYETAVSREIELTVLGGFQASLESEPEAPEIESQADKKSEKLIWEEEGVLAKLLSKSHPLVSLFYLLCIVTLLIASLFALKIFRLSSKRKSITEGISKSTSIEELEKKYKKVVKSLFNLDEDFNRDDLKASVKSSKLPVETSTAIILIYDQVQSRRKTAENSLHELKKPKNRYY